MKCSSKRLTNADYARFLNMAEASLAETDELARMLHALRTKVEQGEA